MNDDQVGDMSQYGQINAEYVRHFKSNPPVRVCVQANIDFPLLMSAIGRRNMKHDVSNDQGKTWCQFYPTFYKQLFYTKIIRAAFLHLQITYVRIFWRKI